MSIFAQVSSTPESVYEEIYQEKFTEDYFIDLFMYELCRKIRDYHTHKTRDAQVYTTDLIETDDAISIIVRSMIYQEDHEDIALEMHISTGVVSFFEADMYKRLIKLHNWWLDTPIKEKVRQAFKNRFGEEFNYAEICKDHRIQEALKLYV